MKRIPYIFKYLVIGLIFSGLAGAQEAIPFVSNVEVTFTCWDNEIDVTFPGKDNPSEPLIAPAQARSEKAIYTGPASFILSKVVRTEEGEISNRTPIANIYLPLDLKKVLIILVPFGAPQENLHYRAIAINDSYEAFPLQSLRFINFTPYKLAGQLGANKFEIEARGDVVSTPDSTKGPKNLVPFRMVRYIEETQTWRPIRSTVFSIPKNMRILVIILDDPREPSLRFVMLRGMEANIVEEETVGS